MTTKLQTRNKVPLKPYFTPAQSGLLQRKCACGTHTVSGQCEECKSKKGLLQRASPSPRGRGTEGEGEVPPIVHEVLRSPGQPLDADTRAFMEPRFGHDFSSVRVHADAKAAESARGVNALAYTVGRDVVFGDAQYRPSSTDGFRLLAHELTHTLQQRDSVLPNTLRVSAPSGASEREAEGIAQAALKGQITEPHAGQEVLLQRQPVTDKVDLTESASPFLASAIGSVAIDSFETGHAELSPGNRAKLAGTAQNIVKLLKRYSLSTVRVIGHTDAIGKESDNQMLGQDRADAVRDALTEMGVPADSIVTESKGETALLVKTEKAEPRNRRAEVRFEPKTSPVGKLIPELREPTAPSAPEKIEFDPRKPYIPTIPTPPPRQLPPDFFKPLPPAPKPTQKSALDVLNEKIVDPVVNGVTRGLGLPKDIQKKILELAHDGVEKGITSGLKSAVGAAGVDSKGQEAIEKAVEAAIKEKGGREGEGARQ